MMICDTHCDTLYMRALQPQKKPCVTMEAMKKGGMSLQTCTLYAGNAGMAGHPYDKAMAEYRAFEHLRDTEGWTRVDSPLEAEDGKVKIHEDDCIFCRDCFGPCPSVDFVRDNKEGFEQ